MLKFILIVFGFFYLLGLLTRSIFRYCVRNTQREMEQQTRQQQTRQRRAPEGSTTVRQNRASSKKINKEVGDYVDYEEIRES